MFIFLYLHDFLKLFIQSVYTIWHIPATRYPIDITNEQNDHINYLQ